jgi:hypothetical protein
LAETDESGRFCLRWSQELPDGRLALAFEDERRLLESSSLVIDLARQPALELSFAPPPRAFSAEATQATVTLASRGRWDALPAKVPVTLTWVRQDKSSTELAAGELQVRETLRLSFATQALGAPGTGDLVAVADLFGRKVETRIPVPVTARVALDAPERVEANSDGDAEFLVSATSAFGKVPSGSVEAVADGRTIGIAAIVAGKAELLVNAGAVSGTRPASLRYLSAAPWWSAGSDRRILLNVPAPSPWRWTPWAGGLFAIALWLLAGWQRPARRELPGTPSRSTVAGAGLEWLAAPEGGGWVGAVSDAHEGTPVAEARVVVLSPEGRVAETTSDSEGRFRLDVPGDTRDFRLRVDGRWHAPLERALPPPGRLSIALLTRRRALLADLVAWARERGAPFFREDREPTPGEVSGAAHESAEPGVRNWARAVEIAAFGPTPVDADREAEVRSAEPKP